MNIFYEESGQFKVASVVQKTDTSYQADTQHGKRVKIKANQVFITFTENMDDFLSKAQNQASEMDTELLWECVGEDEFTAEFAANEYFGKNFTPVQLAATLLALYAAPMYFYKKNKGIFKAATPEVLQQALAAIERKAQQDAQMQNWADQMVSGSLPDEVAADLAHILHNPDKQTLTYKAFHKAMTTLNMNGYELARHTGGVSSMPEYLLQRFALKHFPYGMKLPDMFVPELPENLQTADVQAFSIDDASTTEVDDALSVQDLGDGKKRVGIHIAAPSLGISADSEMEKTVFQRLSTVYFPANKITMLPENWVAAFSLDEGKTVPAFSIYFDVDENWQLSEPTSKIERVPIVKNLRFQEMEAHFNSETGVGSADNPQFPFHAECLYLLELAYELQKQRDRLEDPTRPKKYDYGIDFDENGKVVITRRERGSPIDTLVSEMMILANTSWAKMLHDNELGGLFRVQPSGRVRMSTHSEPHIGMNVAHYGWFTSPLRRACDYINQKQLQSLLDPNSPARFAKNDVDLFVALGNFETAYTAYRAFQDMMENYWALVWLKQENIQEINAILLKEDLVRLEGVPLTARVTGIPMEIAPKSTLKLRVADVDAENRFIALNYLAVVPNDNPNTDLDDE